MRKECERERKESERKRIREKQDYFLWTIYTTNKNDNIFINKVQEIRWFNEYKQIQSSCKYYRISYYIKINLP